jgi:hypothetical protein
MYVNLTYNYSFHVPHAQIFPQQPGCLAVEVVLEPTCTIATEEVRQRIYDVFKLNLGWFRHINPLLLCKENDPVLESSLQCMAVCCQGAGETLYCLDLVPVSNTLCMALLKTQR